MWNSRERKVSHRVRLMCLLRSPTYVLAPAGVDERERVKALSGCSRAKAQSSVLTIDLEFTFNISNRLKEPTTNAPLLPLSSALT